MAKNNQQISEAVHCGEKWQLETVDFGNVDRPKTCLEVDFPILPINSVAAIEGNAGKPIYQMSKWWARRRSSVFRAMLLAAATKVPDDSADAAKTVWDAYYGNHQQNEAFQKIKVADIFMGGGTTIVEGSRLGMEMFGNDLNPVAWFIVKNEMANVDKKEVEALLKEIEEKVKPVIEPFYTCNCTGEHNVSPGTCSGHSEVIYTFWAKHGPCSATGCNHRTPVMQTPVIAVKTLTVKAYPDVLCPKCEATFDIETQDVRIAPKAMFVVADTEKRYGVRDENHTVKCPHCLKKIPEGVDLGEISYKNLKPVNKRIELTLLIHPDWLEGSSLNKGGCADDSAEDTAEWNRERTKSLKLIEVRGTLPEKITFYDEVSDAGLPRPKYQQREMFTDARGGTVPGKSQFKCARCGREQDILTAVKQSGKTAPVAMYAVQGYCPKCDETGKPYGGRFFDVPDVERYNEAARLWERVKCVSGGESPLALRDRIQNKFEEFAVPMEQIPFTPETFESLFGKNRTANTPIGKVKIGANQYEKLHERNREHLLGAMKQTLSEPVFIISEQREDAALPSRLFFKSFIHESGTPYITILCVAVETDGLLISVSTHRRKNRQAIHKIENAAEIIYEKTTSAANEQSGYGVISPSFPSQENITSQTEYNLEQEKSQGALFLTSLNDYYPQEKIPYGYMTGMANGDIRTGHGFTHWYKMFNARQLLGLSLLLKTIVESRYPQNVKDYVLGAFQQYIRNQCMFSFWHLTADKLAPAISNGNFHPKANIVEVGMFAPMGYGPWISTLKIVPEVLDWIKNPWELVSLSILGKEHSGLVQGLKSKSVKVYPGDSLFSPVACQRDDSPPTSGGAKLSGVKLSCGSSNELTQYAADSFDMVITDPPFGGLLYYAELSDFFYVWLRLALKDIYPEQFGGDCTPKALEVIANKSRHDNPDAFYQTMLTQCWRETYRILKPGGILAFTFHHSEDEPWLNVLRSLFEANFYLEATYPIRSDETKGQGEFGSKKIEFDIIHVCRKRMKEPERISWARLRRKILDDVNQITEILDKHQAAGLGEADLQVIRRGKALEHYSQHYGNVFGSDGSRYDLKQVLLSINQVLDEQRDKNTDVPPSEAEPLTRMFLRLFIDTDNMPRDQIQKYLRGTGTAPSELTVRNWCSEKKKVFTILRPPEFLNYWKEKKRGIPKDDFEQAWYLIGVCTEGSGTKFQDIVKPEIFAPHPATLAVIEWFTKHGADEEIRKAARLAQQLWKVNVKEQESPQQKELF